MLLFKAIPTCCLVETATLAPQMLTGRSCKNDQAAAHCGELNLSSGRGFVKEALKLTPTAHLAAESKVLLVFVPPVRWELEWREDCRSKSHSKWISLRRCRRRLHLVGRKMVFWDTVGVSRVALIEAPHPVHFIVDAAGDVLNVLHMGPDEEIP